MIDNTPKAFLDYIQNSEFDYSSLCLWEIETLSSYLGLAAGRAMKDQPVASDHVTERIAIYEADIDIGIIPLVRWLNSLNGIMTRWSCQGENPKEGGYFPPYVTIWVEQYGEPDDNDFELVERFLGQYSVEIENRNTEEWIGVYHIAFSSSTELQKIQSALAAGESMTKVNKTKYLEEHFGGKWKYDNVGSWWCNDDNRHVSRTATCMCEDSCDCPVRYWLYGEEKPQEISDWFSWQFSFKGK